MLFSIYDTTWNGLRRNTNRNGKDFNGTITDFPRTAGVRAGTVVTVFFISSALCSCMSFNPETRRLSLGMDTGSICVSSTNRLPLFSSFDWGSVVFSDVISVVIVWRHPVVPVDSVWVRLVTARSHCGCCCCFWAHQVEFIRNCVYYFLNFIFLWMCWPCSSAAGMFLSCLFIQISLSGHCELWVTWWELERSNSIFYLVERRAEIVQNAGFFLIYILSFAYADFPVPLSVQPHCLIKKTKCNRIHPEGHKVINLNFLNIPLQWYFFKYTNVNFMLVLDKNSQRHSIRHIFCAMNFCKAAIYKMWKYFFLV